MFKFIFYTQLFICNMHSTCLDDYYNRKFCYFIKKFIVINVLKIVVFLIVIYVRSRSTKIKYIILMLVTKNQIF